MIVADRARVLDVVRTILLAILIIVLTAIIASVLTQTPFF
jgi:hypothetical protein